MSFLKLAVHFFEMFLLLVVVESRIWYNLSSYFASLGNYLTQLSHTFLRNERKVVGNKTWIVSAEKNAIFADDIECITPSTSSVEFFSPPLPI